MKSVLVLRIAGLIALLFALGHTYGGVSSHWAPTGDTETLQQMKTYRMNVAGVSRSYYDFYIGFGYSLSVFMFLEAVWLWMLAGLARSNAAAARPFVAALLIASLINIAIAWKYIFLMPVVFGAVLTGCIALSFILLNRESKQTQ